MTRTRKSAAPSDPRSLRNVLGLYPTGVTVVCTADGAGNPHGFTISSFTSLSLDPPLVLFSLKSESPTLPHLRSSKAFTVNVLSSSQAHLSTHFAKAQPDKFATVEWETGRTSLPKLAEALVVLECALWEEYAGGDHVILIGEVIAMEFDPDRRPLVFHRGLYGTVDPTTAEASRRA